MVVKPKSTKYLNRLTDIVTIISKELDISQKDIKAMLDHFFRWLKESLTDPRMPTIKILQLGTFAPKKWKLDWWVRRNLRFYRSGYISKETAGKGIFKVWAVRNRLVLEKLGVETWRKWKKLDPEKFGKLEQNQSS